MRPSVGARRRAFLQRLSRCGWRACAAVPPMRCLRSRLLLLRLLLLLRRSPRCCAARRCPSRSPSGCCRRLRSCWCSGLWRPHHQMQAVGPLQGLVLFQQVPQRQRHVLEHLAREDQLRGAVRRRGEVSAGPTSSQSGRLARGRAVDRARGAPCTSAHPYPPSLSPCAEKTVNPEPRPPNPPASAKAAAARPRRGARDRIRASTPIAPSARPAWGCRRIAAVAAPGGRRASHLQAAPPKRTPAQRGS
mmetsp:Transcript_21267/g.63739  ORF Transcript_21267/g.63739 Transcript_21267/m.63739 type:complete len:247 (+) Transcript_21267:1162-1902(+)